MSYHRNDDGTLDYKAILVYIITCILLPVICFTFNLIYSGIYDDIESNTTLLDKKVDNTTLKLMLENQQLMINSNDKKFTNLQGQVIRMRERK